MSDFRGYDPALEQLDRLKAESMEYSPVCGSGPGIELPHPRTWMQVENQNPRPSCVGHGLTTDAEYCIYLASRGKTVVQLNRMFAWVESQKAGGSRPSESAGASIFGAVKVAKTIGLPLESLYPYKNRFRTEWSPDFYEDAKQRLILNSYRLDTVDKVFDFQKSGMGGIIWGVPWEFNRRAWHCVTSIGSLVDGKLPVANSWGEDWDGDGWTEWSEEKVERYLGIDGTVAFGLSDLSEPQVREMDWSEGGLGV
jgi:hypothetical protein